MKTIAALPSDRSFGLTFTTVFTLVAAWLAWQSNWLWMVFFAAAGLFLLLSCIAASVLRPLNTAWMRLGRALNRVVSPIVLGAVYFGVITPVALVLRIRGRDILQRKLDAAAPSYWKPRDPPGPDPKRSFPRQF